MIYAARKWVTTTCLVRPARASPMSGSPTFDTGKNENNRNGGNLKLAVKIYVP